MHPNKSARNLRIGGESSPICWGGSPRTHPSSAPLVQSSHRFCPRMQGRRGACTTQFGLSTAGAHPKWLPESTTASARARCAIASTCSRGPAQYNGRSAHPAACISQRHQIAIEVHDRAVPVGGKGKGSCGARAAIASPRPGGAFERLQSSRYSNDPARSSSTRAHRHRASYGAPWKGGKVKSQPRYYGCTYSRSAPRRSSPGSSCRVVCGCGRGGSGWLVARAAIGPSRCVVAISLRLASNPPSSRPSARALRVPDALPAQSGAGVPTAALSAGRGALARRGARGRMSSDYQKRAPTKCAPNVRVVVVELPGGGPPTALEAPRGQKGVPRLLVLDAAQRGATRRDSSRCC